MKRIWIISAEFKSLSTQYLRGSLVAIIASTAVLDLSDKFCLNSATANGFHHSQMFKIVMGLEECIAGEELDQDAADAPDVARIAPTKIQYDLWRSIMSGRYNRRMIFILKRSGAEID